MLIDLILNFSVESAMNTEVNKHVLQFTLILERRPQCAPAAWLAGLSSARALL